MPTILTHPIVPLTLAAVVGTRLIPPRLIVAGMVAAIIPDIDVIAFRFGIAYGDAFGHRGMSHSLAFAAGLALLGGCLARFFRAGAIATLAFLFLAAASHGVLDSFTNCGLGIAFLWPWSNERFFAPIQPIEVSPIGIRQFFTPRGVAVMVSEIVWIWMPCLVVALAGVIARRRLARG